MIKYIFIGAMIFLVGCSQKTQKTRTSYNGLPLIEFCNLPNYQKEVFTKAVYSGIMEYWSLSSPTECKNGFQVDLDINDNYEKVPEKFKNVFNKSHLFKYLIIEAVGVFETGRKGGYGHLGSNNARFHISELVDIKGVK